MAITPVRIALGAGIDRSTNDKSAAPSLRDMVNLDFTDDGNVTPRATFEHVQHVAGKVHTLVRSIDGRTAPIDIGECPVDTFERARSLGTGRRVLESVVSTVGSFVNSVVRVVLVTLETNELTPAASFGVARVCTFDDDGVLLDSREVIDSEGMRGLQLTRWDSDLVNDQDRYRLFWVRDTADTVHSQGLTVDFATGNIFTFGSVKDHADSSARDQVPPQWRARPYSVTNRGDMLAAWFRAGAGDWRFVACPLDVDGDLDSASVQMATSGGLDIEHGDVSCCMSTTESQTACWFATHTGASFRVARVDYSGAPSAAIVSMAYSGAVARTACVPYDSVIYAAPDDAIIMAYERLEEGCLSFAAFSFDSGAGTVSAVEASTNDHYTVGGIALADRGSHISYNDGVTTVKRSVLGVCNVAGAQATGSRSYALLALSGPFDARVMGKLANTEAGAYGTPALNGDDYSCPFPDVERTLDALVFPVLCTLRSTVDQSITGDSVDRRVRVTEMPFPAQILRLSSRTPDRVELNGETYLSGSHAYAHDGLGVHMGGFVHGPAWLLADSTAGSLTDGTYRFAVRATYTTAAGTLFDSPTTRYFPDKTAMSALVTGTGLDLELVAGMIDLDMPGSSAARVDIFANYNTVESGDILLRHLLTRSVQTDTSYSQQRVVYSWTAPRSWHETGELLADPLTGVLTPGCVPGLSALCLHRGRLFGVDAFDPRVIRYTTEIVPPTGPTWPDELFIPVANVGGPVVAVASLGDKLMLFQANSVSYVTGDGPTATGVVDNPASMRSAAFSTPELIPGVGCREGCAVVETPLGVVFGHRTGIYKLGFDLKLDNIGAAALGDDDTFEWMCARYLPLRQQVWFLVRVGDDDDSLIMVWDTKFQVWTKFTTEAVLGGFVDVHEADDGTVTLVGGAQRLLFVERDSGPTFSDHNDDEDEVLFPVSFTTSKARVDDALQLRLRRVTLVGEQDSPAAINAVVTISTFNERRGASETSTSSLTFDMSDYADSFQADARAVTQRATEVSATVTLTPQDADTTSTVALSRFVLNVEPVSGPGKSPVAKKAAAS